MRTLATESLSGLGFGYLEDRDLSRGICMWSPDDEWCARACKAEDHRGKANGVSQEPAWGARYVIIDKLNEGKSYANTTTFWVCHAHRDEFIKLNRVTSDIWVVAPNRMCYLVQRIVRRRVYDITYTIETEGYEQQQVEVMTKLMLNRELGRDNRLTSWSDVDVEESA